MKKISIYLFAILCLFLFCGTASATGKKCAYTGRSINNAGFDSAVIVLPEASESMQARLSIPKLFYPKIGNTQGTTKDKVDIYNIKTTSINTYIMTTHAFVYYDKDVNKQSVYLPDYKFTNDSCPEYVFVIINDRAGVGKNNISVFAGDETIKNFIEEKVNENTQYNFLITGTAYESQADNCEGDECNDDNIPKLETCEGMLGEIDSDGNYVENSVGWLLQIIFDYMKIAALVCVFAFSVVDYAKALIGQEQDLFKKANTNTLKRVIFGIVFFILPIIVDFILKVLNTSTCGIK